MTTSIFNGNTTRPILRSYFYDIASAALQILAIRDAAGRAFLTRSLIGLIESAQHYKAFHSSDVAVFANGNEISLNIYIRAARFANVRQIIVEMSHWDPSTLHNADIDVIVVPSMYLYNIVRDHLKLKRPFFPSQASHGTLVQEGVRSSQLCHISPSAGDMVDYENHKTIKREGRKKCSIGVVSRLSYEKNLAFFITVASVLKFQHNITCKYVIIGDGPAMASLQLLATRLNVEEDLSFLGFIESDLYPGMFQSSTFFSIPLYGMKHFA